MKLSTLNICKSYRGRAVVNGVSVEVNQGEIVVISYLGYTTQEIVFNGQSIIDVALEEDAAQLDEVLLIGYGSTTKQDATGAVDKVDDKDFNRGAIVAPQQLIAGKAAGVNVTSGGGAAGLSDGQRYDGARWMRPRQPPTASSAAAVTTTTTTFCQDSGSLRLAV